MLCWMNGEYLEDHELKISPLEHGYLYGIGFFETIRTYEGVPVFLEQHYARLMEALNTYRINMPYTINDLKLVLDMLTEAAAGQDGYFRINVAAGNYGLGLQPASYEQATVIVFRKDLPNVSNPMPKKAVWLENPRNTPEQGLRLKSHHFGNNVRARQELPNLADYEGFFVTEQGYIAEGVTSNIFWVKDGILYTPSIDLGILPGVTRHQVMELANYLGMPVVEGRFTKRAIEEAQEVFVTNSIQELVPIGQLDQIEFAGEDGQVFQKLRFAYRHHIAKIVRGE